MDEVSEAAPSWSTVVTLFSYLPIAELLTGYSATLSGPSTALQCFLRAAAWQASPVSHRYSKKLQVVKTFIGECQDLSLERGNKGQKEHMIKN